MRDSNIPRFLIVRTDRWITKEGDSMTAFGLVLRQLVFVSTLSATVAVGQHPSSAGARAEAGPVPPAIASAKTIFISNAGSDSGLFPAPFSGGTDRAYNQFFAALKAANQFDLVADPSEADLVLELELTAPAGPKDANKQLGAADP